MLLRAAAFLIGIIVLFGYVETFDSLAFVSGPSTSHQLPPKTTAQNE